MKKETFGIDIENILKARRTFGEEQQAKGVVLMAKQRLKIFERNAFAAINAGIGTLGTP